MTAAQTRARGTMRAAPAVQEVAAASDTRPPFMIRAENDYMAPTINRGDVVWAVPADRYRFEGIYVLDMHGCGRPGLYRCEVRPRRKVWIATDNRERYEPQVISADDFNRAVRGHVAAIGKLVAPSLLGPAFQDDPPPGVVGRFVPLPTSAAEAPDAEIASLLSSVRELMLAPEPHRITLAEIMAPAPWEAPLHAAASIPATSQAGIRAKAETVADQLAGRDRRTGLGFGNSYEALAWSLCRDILGVDNLSPVPPPRRQWTEEDEASARASMPKPVVVPATPDIPWMWTNAAMAIRSLPVQGFRLSTACILEAQRAQEGGDVVRAHNLLMAASAAVHAQQDGLGVSMAYNTDLKPSPKKAKSLIPGTPEYREHRAMMIRTYRAGVRGYLRNLRRAQAEHGLPLPPDDGAVMVQHDEPGDDR